MGPQQRQLSRRDQLQLLNNGGHAERCIHHSYICMSPLISARVTTLPTPVSLGVQCAALLLFSFVQIGMSSRVSVSAISAITPIDEKSARI
jgi:hypothetical protein